MAIRSSNIAAALQQYRDGYLPSRNLAPLTRRHYTSDLQQLQRYLTDRLGLTTIDQGQPPHLDGYLAFLDQQGLQGSSRRRKLAAIRSLFRFLVQQRLLVHDPSTQLQPPQRERAERRVLTEAEYKRLLGAVQHEVRDGAIIELLLQTGIRQAECAAITLKACRALKAYLAIRPKIDEEAFFLTKFQRPLGSRAIRNLVRKYLAEAGIAGASTHALRHIFATHHVKQGTKLDVVRQALGHESLATTSVYVGLAREVMDRELQQNAL